MGSLTKGVWRVLTPSPFMAPFMAPFLLTRSYGAFFFLRPIVRIDVRCKRLVEHHRRKRVAARERTAKSVFFVRPPH